MADRAPSPHDSGGWVVLAFGALLLAFAVPEWRAVAGGGAALALGLWVIGWLFGGPGGGRRGAATVHDPAQLSPREFELWVAGLFAALPGWQAEATRSSADQGADVLASGPGGVRLAVQVKRYRAPVGNGAVQAIVASKALYGCTQAVVITSGPGYTRAAQELARANGVGLWGRAELETLDLCAQRRRALPPELLPTPASGTRIPKKGRGNR